MAKTIKVFIGGKEYSLRGDDEKLIQRAAAELNFQLKQFNSRYKDENSSTLTVLAALNLAENNLMNERQREVNQSYVINEINKMVDYLTKHL